MSETTYIHHWTNDAIVMSASADHFAEPGDEDVTLACAPDCRATPSEGGRQWMEPELTDESAMITSTEAEPAETPTPLAVQRRDVLDEAEPESN